MDLKLKICGMKNPENIKKIAALAPDYLGFIFYEKSPRYVKDEILLQEEKIKKVGVFVDASEAYILKKLEKYGLSAVQLHGNESPEFCRGLKKAILERNLKAELIKVFSVGEDFDFELLKVYEKEVDFFLFDTKGRNRGGNGISFNWEILKKYNSATPFFLSGGIGPESLQQIKDLYTFFRENGKENLFYALDVNSRFEVSPGLKNVEQLSTFKRQLLEQKN
ncbi:MAG: phosphoribosylanthranilate isomerase [Salinimicrobium sp.]